jgi:hypothetical protein
MGHAVTFIIQATFRNPENYLDIPSLLAEKYRCLGKKVTNLFCDESSLSQAPNNISHFRNGKKAAF